MYSESVEMSKTLFALVEKNGIIISRDKLKNFNEGDIVEIEKIIVVEEDKEDFIRKFVIKK